MTTWRVIDAGYTSQCAVCHQGDRKLVALPFAKTIAHWLCLPCARDAAFRLESEYRKGDVPFVARQLGNAFGVAPETIAADMALPWNAGKSPLLRTPTNGHCDGDLHRCSRCGDPRKSHRQTMDDHAGRCFECECAGYEA